MTPAREVFSTMDPHQVQDIREDYLKAAEGLHGLANALSELPSLASEYAAVLEALQAFKKCRLGL